LTKSAVCSIFKADNRLYSTAYGRIPYSKEQRIFSTEQGILIGWQGIFCFTTAAGLRGEIEALIEVDCRS
jgi:hypothetical protein